jgi:hypothetical protein
MPNEADTTDVEAQRTAVSLLDRVTDAVRATRETQMSVNDDLQALYPALLDRALHGELSGANVRVAEADSLK